MYIYIYTHVLPIHFSKDFSPTQTPGDVWTSFYDKVKEVKVRGPGQQMFVDMGVSINGGTQNGWFFVRENPSIMDDLGVPLF